MKSAAHAAMHSTRVEAAARPSIASAETGNRMIMESTADRDRPVPVKVMDASANHNWRSRHHQR
jgi:hypothetical protein